MTSEILNTIASGLSAGMKHPRNVPQSFGDNKGTCLSESTPYVYKVYSCTDILNLLRPQWRVKDVLPTTGLAAIYGPSRAGKSFLALDLALAITRGANWFYWQTIPCPVLYVNLESSWGLHGRIKAWMLERDCTLPDNLNFIIDDFNLLSSKHVDAIIQAAPQNGVVIIDTLNRATPGTDENSSKDMGNIIKAATEIQTVTNGLVLLVTHTGKDAKHGIRGHSSLIAALDAAIEVKWNGDARILKLDKVKEGQDGLLQGFQLKIVTIGDAPNINETTSCIVEPADLQGKTKPLTPALQYALDSFDKTCAATGTVNVNLEAWRPIFYEGHTGEKMDSKRKAFDRTRNKLVAEGILSVHDDIYSRTTGLVPDKQAMS